MVVVKDAIVHSIHPDGKHGPYATAISQSLQTKITFSLQAEVWIEGVWPEPGTYVVLSGLTKKRAGWRAQHGRFLKPDDEKEEN